MNLDSAALYKLTKIGIKDANSKALQSGDIVMGPAAVISINDSSVLRISNLQTSIIEEYTENEDGSFLVETQNSFYTLEKA